RLAEGSFRHCKRKDDLPDDDVLALVPLAGGGVAATRKGLGTFDDPSAGAILTPHSLLQVEHVSSPFVLHDKLWFLGSATNDVPSIWNLPLVNGMPDRTRPHSKADLGGRRVEGLKPAASGRLVCELSTGVWYGFDAARGALDETRAEVAPYAALVDRR